MITVKYLSAQVWNFMHSFLNFIFNKQ